jgi:hypothetical protein
LEELRVLTASGGARVKERNRGPDIQRLSEGRWRIIRSFNFPDK